MWNINLLPKHVRFQSFIIKGKEIITKFKSKPLHIQRKHFQAFDNSFLQRSFRELLPFDISVIVTFCYQISYNLQHVMFKRNARICKVKNQPLRLKRIWNIWINRLHSDWARLTAHEQANRKAFFAWIGIRYISVSLLLNLFEFMWGCWKNQCLT